MRTGPNWQSAQGATLVESALLMLLIGALAISAVSFFGAQVSGLTDQVADGSDGVMSTPTTPPPTRTNSSGNASSNDNGSNTGPHGVPFTCPPENFNPPAGFIPPAGCGVGNGP
ncbi:MAG: hypothetical protein OEY55_11515 [Acidimicrobiia bacterium]|nr:hypothetical protein [Acidimicrobiia bacterium]MDH5505226.1 hypothetical protein [Acidimicrobiia bacterium]